VAEELDDAEILAEPRRSGQTRFTQVGRRWRRSIELKVEGPAFNSRDAGKDVKTPANEGKAKAPAVIFSR